MGGGITGKWSETALRALGAFGLTTSDVETHASEHARGARSLAKLADACIGPGEIALVRGPSGAGKSTLLRAIVAEVRTRGGAVIEPRDVATLGNRRVIDLLAASDADVPRALRILSAAGLADALIPARVVRDLSDGQRARLAVALAVREAEEPRWPTDTPITIAIDELSSTLDETTGQGLCITLARWTRRAGNVRVIAASPREPCAEWLSADIAIDAPTGHIERLRERRAHLANTPRPHADSITISNGTIKDYRAMARWHYRPGAPATCARVLVARHGAETIGVLVVSMPTLNGAWREQAWPGRYTGPRVSKQAAAARLNRDIRCISRLIVDPRYRGRGVGARLVRHYLLSPLTRRTEAIAAMGAASPMFVRAGMREWIGEPTNRDSRLIDALQQANLRPWHIADVREMVRRAQRDRPLERALRAWAMKHGATRRLADGPIEDIIAAAARSIVQRPRAYTAER